MFHYLGWEIKNHSDIAENNPRHRTSPFVYRAVQRQKLKIYDILYLMLGLTAGTRSVGQGRLLRR